MDRDPTDDELELIREMTSIIDGLRSDLHTAHRVTELAQRDAGTPERALGALLEGYQRAVIAGHLAVPGLAEAALNANRVLWRITSKREPPRVLPPDPTNVETIAHRLVPPDAEPELTLSARVAALEASLDILATDHHHRLTTIEVRLGLQPPTDPPTSPPTRTLEIG